MALLQKLNAQGMTIVMVTHEPDIAAFASRIVTFRDGKIISDVKNTPANAQSQLSAVTVETS
jgi:putative ABC transport system ATP-binding protein